MRKAASHQAQKGKYAFNFKLSSWAPHCGSPPANSGRENSNILGFVRVCECECECVCVCSPLCELFIQFTRVTRAVDSRGVLLNRGSSLNYSSGGRRGGMSCDQTISEVLDSSKC